MPLKPIEFISDRDKQYQKLYQYFVRCQTRQQSIKIQEIKTILDKTDTTVYGRIRRHWNEFIKEHPSRNEYIVYDLKSRCPEKYFVLAHKHRQAKHFYIFNTAIEKHNRHIEHYRLVKQRQGDNTQLVLTFDEEPEDHIPGVFDDEGKEYPEDPASEVLVDDDEAGNVVVVDEDTIEDEEEETEEEGKTITLVEDQEVVLIMYGENLRSQSVHVASPYIDPEPPTNPVLPPEGPKGDESPPRPPFDWKKAIRTVVTITFVVVAIVVIIKYIFH